MIDFIIYSFINRKGIIKELKIFFEDFYKVYKVKKS